MKIVKELNVGNIQPMAGCVCSSGRNSARGPWDPIWNCNCSCDGGIKNDSDNHTKAYKA